MERSCICALLLMTNVAVDAPRGRKRRAWRLPRPMLPFPRTTVLSRGQRLHIAAQTRDVCSRLSGAPCLVVPVRPPLGSPALPSTRGSGRAWSPVLGRCSAAYGVPRRAWMRTAPARAWTMADSTIVLEKDA